MTGMPSSGPGFMEIRRFGRLVAPESFTPASIAGASFSSHLFPPACTHQRVHSFQPTHHTLTYSDRALKVTIRPFHHMSFLGDHPTRPSTRLCVERCLVRCQCRHGSRPSSVKVVPIQPILLISFLGPISGRTFVRPSSPHALRLRRSSVQVTPSDQA